MSWKRATPIALAATALALVMPAASPAAITIGPQLGGLTPLPNGYNCSATKDCTLANLSLGSIPAAPGGFASPVNGSVSAVVLKTGAGDPPEVTMRVLRPAGGGAFLGAGTGPTLSFPSSATTRIPTTGPSVRIGDIVGVQCCFSGNDNITGQVPLSGSSTATWGTGTNPALADGQTAAPDSTNPDYLMLMNAEIEPDNKVKIHKAKVRKGKVKLRLTVPNDGIASVEPGPLARKKCSVPKCGLQVKPMSQPVKAGAVTLVARLTKAVRSYVRRNGRFTFKVSVGFLPTHGVKAVQESARVTVKAKPKG